MYDIYDDNGALLRRFYPQREDLPAFVRESGIPSYGDLVKSASDDFAVSIPLENGIRRAYPIANDATTAVSCFYFENTHQNLHPELQKQAAANLKEACDRFGIEVDPDSAVAKLASEYHEKKASASPFKIAFQSQGIAGTSMFPISTPEQVKLASDNFNRIIPKLAPEERREFSQALMQKAAEFGVRVTPDAAIWGGTQLSPSRLIDGLNKRASYMTENQRQLLHMAADRIAEMHPDKVAELLEQMDSELGLEAMYDSKVPDPRAIYEQPASLPKMAKLAEGFEIPMSHWQDAVDKGVLDHFEPQVKTALKGHPELLQQYVNTPVFEHVVNGLESLGIVERAN